MGQSFRTTDFDVGEELRRASSILRSGQYREIRDSRLAALLANAMDQWTKVAGLDPDLLNRIGGPEIVDVARFVIDTSVDPV